MLRQQSIESYRFKSALHFSCIISFLLLSLACSSPRQITEDTSQPTTDSNSSDSLGTPYFNQVDKAKYITSDKLQQCYTISKSNELVKYNAKGVVLFRFNNNRLGELSWVDATDPFNLLLYYPEYMTLITLDRTLGMTGEFQLYDMDIAEVTAVAMTNDNNIWLHDQTRARIVKINKQGNILNESGNLNLLFENISPPNFMLEHDNLLYVNIPDRGILVFDNFATYLKTIPIKSLERFQIIDKQLIYEEGNAVNSFHLKSLLTQTLELPFSYKQGDQVRIQKDVLFVLKNGRLLFYKL